MSRSQYRLSAAGSKIEVLARSSVHDTTTCWPKVTGAIEVDPDDLGAGAVARFEVDMTDFDAGDWLKNRKLKKDLEVAKHPTATFELIELVDIESSGDKTSAKAKGTLSWRGRSVAIEATGSATIDQKAISASASFDLNVRDVGVTPPKILMFKVEEIVTVRVTLLAATSQS